MRPISKAKAAAPPAIPPPNFPALALWFEIGSEVIVGISSAIGTWVEDVLDDVCKVLGILVLVPPEEAPIAGTKEDREGIVEDVDVVTVIWVRESVTTCVPVEISVVTGIVLKTSEGSGGLEIVSRLSHYRNCYETYKTGVGLATFVMVEERPGMAMTVAD